MRKAGRIGLVCKGDYSETKTYERLHFVYYNGSSYVAKKTTIGNKPEHDNEYWHILANGGELQRTSDVSNTVVENIVQFGGRINIVAGDRLSDIAGKMKKWFSDMKTVAFSGKYTDLEGKLTLTNNLLATIPGTALDAAQGKILSDRIAQLNSDLSGAKGIRLFTQYISAMSTDENGNIYYDFVSADDLPQYSSPIVQNSYYTYAKTQVLGTRNIAKNTIRIYFSNNAAPTTVSILYKVKL